MVIWEVPQMHGGIQRHAHKNCKHDFEKFGSLTLLDLFSVSMMALAVACSSPILLT